MNDEGLNDVGSIERNTSAVGFGVRSIQVVTQAET